MKYNILTTSNKSYFPHLQILTNSILEICDLSYINKFFIADTGLTKEQINYLKNKSNIFEFISTGTQTSFKGGTWGDDWQINVKGKSAHLYNLVSTLKEPFLMLDADMMVTKDLYPLLKKGGDIQVCVRPGHSVKYIGSYFFSINHKKSLPFIKDWKDLTQKATGKGAHESPALSKTVESYKNNINIVEISQNEVNRIEYPPLNETTIVHFKGSSLHNTFEEQFNNRVKNRAGGAWNTFTDKYLI